MPAKKSSIPKNLVPAEVRPGNIYEGYISGEYFYVVSITKSQRERDCKVTCIAWGGSEGHDPYTARTNLVHFCHLLLIPTVINVPDIIMKKVEERKKMDEYRSPWDFSTI